VPPRWRPSSVVLVRESPPVTEPQDTTPAPAIDPPFRGAAPGATHRPQSTRAVRQHRRSCSAWRSWHRPRRGEPLGRLGLHLGRRPRRRPVQIPFTLARPFSSPWHRRQRAGRRDLLAAPVGARPPSDRFRTCSWPLRRGGGARRRRASSCLGSLVCSAGRNCSRSISPPWPRMRSRARPGRSWPSRRRVRARRPAAWWLLVVAVWAGPLIIQLASPAAPFYRRPPEPRGAGGACSRIRQLCHAHHVPLPNLRPLAPDARVRRSARRPDHDRQPGGDPRGGRLRLAADDPHGGLDAPAGLTLFGASAGFGFF